MKLWQQPAQPLPIRLRPVHGETLISYLLRLADANSLGQPTTLLRALGEPAINLTPSMLTNHDITLNHHALHRLVTITTLGETRLRRALPALHQTKPPTPHNPGGNHRSHGADNTPTTRPCQFTSLRPHCDTCTSRLPGHPKIIVHHRAFPKICVKHQRWIDTHNTAQPQQVDLAETPEILTAHRRFTRLHTQTADNDQGWLNDQLWTASWIVRKWAWTSRQEKPGLYQRWKKRSTTIRPHTDLVIPTELLIFPETVALTEIIADPHWRRHTARATHHREITPFHHRIAARLGQPPTFATHTQLNPHDPLNEWIKNHQEKHQHIRTKHHNRRRNNPHATHIPETYKFQ